jgi:hypothetical protein
MKKQIAIAAMAMLTGATVGQAQTITTTVSNGVTIAKGPINLTVKGKLIGATKLAGPTVTGLQWAQVLDPISATRTDTVDVIGTVILDSSSSTNGTTNTVSSSISTNAFLVSDDRVDLGKGKFAEASFAENFNVAGPFGSSNTECYITGTVKTDKKGVVTVSAKAVGIWQAGVSAFSASISTAKAKK